MNWFRRLKAAWLFTRIEPYLPQYKWAQGDSEALSIFMTSETGKKLRRMLSNRVIQTATQATLKTSDKYESGYAGGCRGTAAFIDSHLTISPWDGASPETEDVENQDALELERLRP